jgi:quercetin dioxygenase-like cupin family protein
MNFDIPSLIETLKQDPSWSRRELSTMVLLKSPVKNIVLTLLPAGIEIRSVQLNDTITYQVLEGKLKFQIRNESVVLGKGELLKLNEKTKYLFDSLEESAFLLTSENTVQGQRNGRLSLNNITFTF